MVASKIRMAVLAAILAAVGLAAVLAWRGVLAVGEIRLPHATTWREADETDLF